MAVAKWDEERLIWEPLPNSVVSSDGSQVSAALTHFSIYTVVYQPSEKLTMEIAPNPFSPYILPHYNPFDTLERLPQHYGTCIRLQSDISASRTEIKLRIYTINGDLVWSFILHADNLPYYVWWDGRTSSRELQPAGSEHVISVKKGERMCRNGRYFAVASARIGGKEQRVMKHMVLMK